MRDRELGGGREGEEEGRKNKRWQGEKKRTDI